MKLIARIIIAVVANAIGLLAAAHFVPGFGLTTGDYEAVAALAAILTLLNFFIKPLLKLVLAPVIILTLGLGLILVNGLVLYILDILVDNLTIEGIVAYLLGGLVIGLVNFVFHLAQKK